MKEKVCCFIGHRDLTHEQTIKILQLLIIHINELMQRGYTHFISGMTSGSDILSAQIVGSFRHKNESLILEAAIPYRNKLKSTDKGFKYALMHCNKITVIQEQYSPRCFQKRNKYMIDKSSVVVAIGDGRASGKTCNTVKYAKSLGKEIIQINPLQE